MTRLHCLNRNRWVLINIVYHHFQKKKIQLLIILQLSQLVEDADSYTELTYETLTLEFAPTPEVNDLNHSTTQNSHINISPPSSRMTIDNPKQIIEDFNYRSLTKIYSLPNLI
jgi:hypothetical protein